MYTHKVIFTICSREGYLDKASQTIEEKTIRVISSEANQLAKGQKLQIVVITSDDARHKKIAGSIITELDTEHIVRHMVYDVLWEKGNLNDNMRIAMQIITKLLKEVDMIFLIVPSDFDYEASSHVETKPATDLPSTAKRGPHVN